MKKSSALKKIFLMSILVLSSSAQAFDVSSLFSMLKTFGPFIAAYGPTLFSYGTPLATMYYAWHANNSIHRKINLVRKDIIDLKTALQKDILDLKTDVVNLDKKFDKNTLELRGEILKSKEEQLKKLEGLELNLKGVSVDVGLVKENLLNLTKDIKSVDKKLDDGLKDLKKEIKNVDGKVDLVQKILKEEVILGLENLKQEVKNGQEGLKEFDQKLSKLNSSLEKFEKLGGNVDDFKQEIGTLKNLVKDFVTKKDLENLKKELTQDLKNHSDENTNKLEKLILNQKNNTSNKTLNVNVNVDKELLKNLYLNHDNGFISGFGQFNQKLETLIDENQINNQNDLLRLTDQTQITDGFAGKGLKGGCHNSSWGYYENNTIKETHTNSNNVFLEYEESLDAKKIKTDSDTKINTNFNLNKVSKIFQYQQKKNSVNFNSNFGCGRGNLIKKKIN